MTHDDETLALWASDENHGPLADLARELLAARKVVEAARKIERLPSGEAGFCRIIARAAITAYDQARNPSEGE